MPRVERDETPITTWEHAHDLIVRMAVLAPEWKLWSVEWRPDFMEYVVTFDRPSESATPPAWMHWRVLPTDDVIIAMLARFTDKEQV